jgi:hypothetical protein
MLLEATLTEREGTTADLAEASWFLASPPLRTSARVLHENGGALDMR